MYLTASGTLTQFNAIMAAIDSAALADGRFAHTLGRSDCCSYVARPRGVYSVLGCRDQLNRHRR